MIGRCANLPSRAGRFLVAAVCLLPGSLAAQEGHAEHPHAAPRSAAAASANASVAAAGAERPSRTLTVGSGPDRDHESLPGALAAAMRGDTIRVASGVYGGNVLLDRRLTLLGSPGAVLRGNGTGSVVTMVADSSEIGGFRVERSGRSLNTDDAAITMAGCRACRAVENELPDVLHGVYVMESAHVVVRDNRITGDRSLPEARRGNGIHVYNSRGPRIRGNLISGTRDGIYFSFASGATVAENVVTGARYGLHYMYSDDNRFERNEFRENTAGAALMFSKRIEFSGNSFTRHLGLQAYGLLLQTVEDVRATGNLVAGNRVGLHLDNATRSDFRRNVIAGNGVGVDLRSSAEDNAFTENEIHANRLDVRQGSRGAANRWSENGRGNFWASHEVFDLDGDGVGDRPYTVGDPFSVLAARRPSLEPFIGTPAARALSWAERSFPVFDIPRAVDPAPLTRSPIQSLGTTGVRPGTAPAGVPRFGLLALAAVGLVAALAPIAIRHRVLRPFAPRADSGPERP
jgi:nitrous oxidase accessory protein